MQDCKTEILVPTVVAQEGAYPQLKPPTTCLKLPPKCTLPPCIRTKNLARNKVFLVTFWIFAPFKDALFPGGGGGTQI